jgi:uncharacterized protein (DUF983 family)
LLPVTITQSAARADHTPSRPALASLAAGFRLRCPNCKRGCLLKTYLKVADHCPVCGEAFYHQRTDDAPAYFTILIVGHLVLPTMLIALQLAPDPAWVHFVVWPLLAIGLTFTLLPRVKGALVALQWALRMHGFGDAEDLIAGH